MNQRVAKKQVISFVLAVALIFSGIMFPVNNAQAAEAGIVYYDWDETSKQLVKKTISEEDCTVVTKGTTKLTGAEGGSWYIVNESIEITERIIVEGEVHLILADGINFVANRGISVNENDNNVNSLSIYAQSLDEETMGSLDADGLTEKSEPYPAGIGGDNGKTAGKIAINGGNITTKSLYGAGIGGGKAGNSGDITINGGNINISQSNYAAGIGGGHEGNGENITINGGNINLIVNSLNTPYGAGIGGGQNGNSENITINGGNIKVYSWYGAGIGAGQNGNGGNITINGGTIDTNTVDGAGIGGGYDGNGENITINGGNINSYSTRGAGIGGGYNKDYINNENYGNGGNIIINKGIIDSSSTFGAGIGGGMYGSGGNITINGGDINARSVDGAGIGGGANYDSSTHETGIADGGTITINGGTIDSRGSDDGAGIGGGYYGGGGTITFNGGTVTSVGVVGAGVGGGNCGDSGIITINEGNITATGDYHGAGIGGGFRGNAEIITINNGQIEVKATSGAAGIGGGSDAGQATGAGNAGTITINNGTITVSADDGAGIGTGWNGKEGNITISGGTISAKADRGAGIGSGEAGNIDAIIISDGDFNIYSFCGAGIGSGQYGSVGTITIKDGKLAAESSSGAGIGCGDGGSMDTLIVDEGEISAKSRYGAGIGGGEIRTDTDLCMDDFELIINSGHISAESESGAGIGGGRSLSAGNVYINGGIIDSKSSLGAGIGGGDYNKNTNQSINISAGTITAVSDTGAGIGGGDDGYGNNINITGGNIKAFSANADRIGNGINITTETSDLYKNIRTITLCGMTEQTPIDSAVGIGNYGLTDVLTLDDNKLYFYLPSNYDMSSVTADKTLYIGRLKDGEDEATFHNCTYTKDEKENKIIATCTTENCVSYEISIAKPDDTTYTGKAIEAQVTVNPENSFVPEVTYVANTGSLTDGKPVNAGNYTASITLGEETISVTYDITKTGAPAEMPSSSMKVTCDKKMVKDIELPTDWTWKNEDAEKAVTVGKTVTATAVYTGSDKGCYEIEEGKVTITSEHTGKTEVKDTKEATYDEAGYTGDTCCKDCGAVIKKGTEVAKLVKNAVDVKYATHVQSYGWQDEVKNGAMSGTSGQAKRLEGIVISVDSDDDLGIQYTTHCQTYGWLPWVSNGDMSGTTGEAKRLEAIMIKLTGADAKYYDVYYRVHAQSYGWLNWAKNGEPSGTAGYAKRLEGIQIVVVKKGEAIDEKLGGIVSTNDKAYIATEGKSPIYDGTTTDNTKPVVGENDLPTVKYRTHVQSYGWLNYEYNGGMSGTSGEAKRLEGIDIDVSNTNMSGDIVYTTHAQSYGWQSDLNDKTKWFKNGQIAGTLGEAKRLEAICIDLTGELKENYDIYYRVHIQSYGWLDWACNGAPSGSEGLAKRLEGIQIVIVPKGSGKPAASYMGITTSSDKSYIK